MQSDIIKRPPAEPEARPAEKPAEAPVESTPQPPATEAPVPAVDVIKTQEVSNVQAEPVADEIKPGEKPQKKQKTGEKVATQADQSRTPAGPGMAIGTAIFVCLVLIGLVVYSQMS